MIDKYTLEQVTMAVNHWSMCKVEAPYIEAFLDRTPIEHAQKESTPSTEAENTPSKESESILSTESKSTPPTKSESTPPYNYVDPPHYTVGSIEVIDMMVRIWGEQRVADYCEINAFKYRMRIGKKPHQTLEQELKKAIWYEDKAKELRSKM